jgi:hypothetical protein
MTTTTANSIQIAKVMEILLAGDRHPQYNTARRLANEYIESQREQSRKSAAFNASQIELDPAWTR